MAKVDKLVKRLLSKPKDLTFDEMVKILKHFGYSKVKMGKTRGSRRKFANNSKQVITLHEPHPEHIIKEYAITQVIDTLNERGHI